MGRILPGGLTDAASVPEIGIAQTETTSDESLGMWDAARLAAAGATWNLSDEILAGIKSLASQVSGGDLTFDQAVAEERKIIEDARKSNPKEALGYELGGAGLAAIATMLVTGGASTPVSLARMAGIGAGHATAAAIGAREGSPIERVTKDPEDLALATAAGVVLGPVVGKGAPALAKGAIKAVTYPINKVREVFGNKLTNAVEAEIARLIEEGGIPIDELINRIGAGEIFPDVSPEAARALRAVYSKLGTGGRVVSETITRRADELPARASAALQSDLVPQQTTGNIVKAINETVNSLKKQESTAYNKIFDEALDEPSIKLNSIILELANNNLSLVKNINELVSAAGKKSLFKETDDGLLELTRNVTLEESEIVRRAVKDAADGAYANKQGSLGGIFKEIELTLRGAIDDISPALASTRANYAKMFAIKDAFDDGRKIFGKIPDDAEIIWERILASGDDDVIAAFRAGAGALLRGKRTTGAKTTLYSRLDNIEKRERLILEMIYPGESLEAAVKKIDLANRALKTKGVVLGGSPTQPAQEAARRIGTQSLIPNLVIFAKTLDPMAGIRVVKDLVGKRADNLTQKQLAEIANILVSENAELFRKSVTQPAVINLLTRKANAVIDTVLGKSLRRGMATVLGGDIGSEDRLRSIRAISGMMSPTAKRKVQATTGRVMPQ